MNTRARERQRQTDRQTDRAQGEQDEQGVLEFFSSKNINLKFITAWRQTGFRISSFRPILCLPLPQIFFQYFGENESLKIKYHEKKMQRLND